jgi:hypothetical protein
MRVFFSILVLLVVFANCQKADDSDELFSKAEGYVKLNMYKEALPIYIELKGREYKLEIVEERIRFVSQKIAEERLKAEAKSVVTNALPDAGAPQPAGTGSASQGFKVSRCDSSYNDRIEEIKREMKPYQDELSEIEKKLQKISSEYKVVNIDGGYSFAVPADTPKEKQKEIAEGPAREFGTLNARKTELQAKINKYNEDIAKVVEEARKAGQPSDCIKR